MKTSLKANLLKHLIAKKEEGGFTLIELLVVIIIIGILAAIALPSFLNQANKAKQSEAKTYVGSMNRAQQAYFLENNTFASNADFPQLGLGIKTETGNYFYGINTATANLPKQLAVPRKVSTESALKAYAGGVTIATLGAAGTSSADATTIGALCEALLSPIQGGPGANITTLPATPFTAVGGVEAGITGVGGTNADCSTTGWKEVK